MTPLSAQRPYVIKGVVYDAADSTFISFARLRLQETGEQTMSNAQGQFVLHTRYDAVGHLTITAMGYMSQSVVVTPKVGCLCIHMQAQSFALGKAEVTAQYRHQIGSDATVGQEALEYIQPTSLQDVFTLLPGGKMGSNHMQNGSLISSRQVGADHSTSFGMGMVINGIPLDNDGMRVQLAGLTGGTNMDGNGNVTVNQGLDLRTFSTDHIESVTVTKGVSSVKEGNLSSGSIKVELKHGKSPLRVRTKFDPKNKLLYIGKGMSLGRRAGTLYMGADMVKSAAAIEDRRGAYHRITMQTNYNNQIQGGWAKVDVNVNGSYVTSFNNRKTDEQITAFRERYNTQYQRATFSSKWDIYPEQTWLNHLELMTSIDYTSNQLKHHKHVINTSVTPVPNSSAPGEHEGQFLPKNYDTYYRLDNRPLRMFAQMTVRHFGILGNHMNYSCMGGGSITATKNWGRGTVSDAERPPFPASDYIRPRSNRAIPAIVHEAAYVETNCRYHTSHFIGEVQMGIRQVLMLNLPSKYALSGKPLWEPRVQGSCTFQHEVGGHRMRHIWRVGYGQENKLPSADYLYPDLIYHDYMALNAYFNNPSQRRLITHTQIFNPTNPNLRENRNRKIECGYDWSWKKYACSITAFVEKMSNGISYLTQYQPTSFTYYYALRHPVTGKPEREDYYQREERIFAANRIPTNSVEVIKRGIEYRVHIPTLYYLHTEIEINGAFYRTTYANGIPIMHYPQLRIGGSMYPYVGVFDGFEKQHRDSFNTNIWLNTHLPKWKLIFTNFFQLLWWQSSQWSKNVDVWPSRYLDMNNQLHDFTPENLAANPLLGQLKREFNTARYEVNKMPFSMAWNVKCTKEFNSHVKLSFFGDNILTIQPKYKNAYQRTMRVWTSPFFGAELTLNL